ncbi:MAG: glucosamine-6-phosphate deaminase [Oscillospiraceae bacterium]|jgi:glucosamine-6-phosphate deaminase|nr:glucosamine-6-phosphate deaminase [Oscillospiraceae bacterium]
MKIINTANYEEMSRAVADLILEEVRSNPKTVLGLATGSTPLGAYSLLANAYKSGAADFSGVVSVNLDEYCGLAPDNHQSYRYFMDKNLFSHINIDRANTHVPDGTALNPEAEAERYEKLIESLGGIDLQLLGLGHNGHVAFIEPGDEFPAKTRHVYLDEQTIKANSRFFERHEDIPESAISIGIKAIMGAEKIILAVSGNDKANILKKSLYGAITPQVPASVLQLHNNLTIITDCLG